MLSDELDHVPYPDRIPALLNLLRERDDPAGRIAEMAAGGPYDRYLAVVAAAASGLRHVVVEALHDPDFSVRSEAVRQAMRQGWADAGELLADAPPVLRRLIVRELRRRPGSGDPLIDMIRERHGDQEAAALLPACTADTVARLLPYVKGSWKALARRHSTVVLTWADDRLTAGDDWSRVLDAVQACTAAKPEMVLDLLERHAPEVLPDVDTEPLARRSPDRLAALLIARGKDGTSFNQCGLHVLRHLMGLGTDRLAGLHVLNFEFLELLAPQRRAEVYAAAPGKDIPWEGHVELLPEPLRTREVRRVLALVAADEQATRLWRRYRPAAEVLPEIAEQARDRDPSTRGDAYAAMIRVAVREPAALPDVMDRLLRARNEREKVRGQMLGELKALIPHLTPEVVPTLTAITDAAIEAPDVSIRYRDTLPELAWQALAMVRGRDLTGWALGMIARVPIPWYLETPLRTGQEHLVTAALSTRISADVQELFALVGLLETRARHVPEIQELLRRATTPTTAADVRERAATMWLDDPATRAERAAALVRADPAAALLAPVWREITGYSTTLLDPSLAGPPTHVRRWTPRQQRAYAETVAAVAADDERTQRARTAAVKHLARVPVTGRELLTRFLDGPEVPLVEAALTALSWTDRPGEALPVLLGHAGGDRARVALPAAARAARFVGAADLPDLLRGVLFDPAAKVTSRKAAVRLLARYGPPEFPRTLTELWRTPGTHPDVRAAVVTAMPRLSPPAWEVDTEAAGPGTPAETLALLDLLHTGAQEDLDEPGRRRLAALVTAACTDPDAQVRRRAYALLGTWMPWSPQAPGLAVAALADPEPRGLYGLPLSLVGALLDGPGADVLQPLLDGYAARDAADTGPSTGKQDRLARRRTGEILGAVALWARANPGADREPARRLARHLATRPGFRGEGAELLIALDGPTPEVADLLAGHTVLTAEIAAGITGRQPDTTPAAARELADRGDLTGGLLALGLVTAGGKYGYWSDPWVEEMNHLRRHPHPEVAEAALRRPMTR
ncbi:hypothetical protein [Actinoplanes couchii]|uniref:PBS lyase HEAT domain protein repeat-containing protein n=1 Tax=Actinoplanes couchii TaxID=403638 RepID=A0ABQ3XRY3_9ACTN|nr:hypothetical protein [Actinoplanes couchii]MDR6318914.1 hypothetical protein [Actinoplanes couchii]GID61147.1 hypothetical protein Aco03nite_095510 [Actinoplanes couchii]